LSDHVEGAGVDEKIAAELTIKSCKFAKADVVADSDAHSYLWTAVLCSAAREGGREGDREEGREAGRERGRAGGIGGEGGGGGGGGGCRQGMCERESERDDK